MLKIISILFLLFVKSTISQLPIGPVGNLKLKGLSKCDMEIHPPKRFSLTYNVTENEKSQNEVNVNITLPWIIDKKNTKYFLRIDKWTHDNWVKNIYSIKGSLCEKVGQFFPKAWARLAKSVGLAAKCPWQPGTYRFKNIQVEKKDLSLPLVHYGKLNLDLLVKRNNIDLFCVSMKFDSFHR